MRLAADLRADLGGEWTPLEGGLSHHVWHVARRDAPPLAVRIPDGSASALLFGRDPAAEWLALTALDGTGLAPRPVRLHGGAVVAEYLEGNPWVDDFVAVGRALRALHAQPVPEGLPRAPRCAVGAGEAILRRCRDRALRDLRPMPAPLEGPEVFLHGDPVAGNVIMQGATARLIDWQCPARGPALHDVALFLSPAMMQIARGRAADAEEIAAFTAGYGPLPAGAMAPLHWRMACHCQWRIEQGHGAYRAALAAELTALARAAAPR